MVVDVIVIKQRVKKAHKNKEKSGMDRLKDKMQEIKQSKGTKAERIIKTAKIMRKENKFEEKRIRRIKEA